jgi:hypothetical protein
MTRIIIAATLLISAVVLALNEFTLTAIMLCVAVLLLALTERN